VTVESDISISEDPSLTFEFAPNVAAGERSAGISDRNNRHFVRNWPVKIVRNS